MAIETLYPAIRPSLNLDFAGSKTLDPRITFSRASAATYYDGKTVAKVEENLLTYSQDFGNSVWAKSSSTVIPDSITAPDGANTADTLLASAGVVSPALFNAYNQVSTLPHVVSFFAKAGTHSFIQYTNNCGASTFVNFNLATGQVGTKGASVTEAVMIPFGNGWYRCVLSISTLQFTHLRLVQSSSASYGETFAATGTESVHLWGAQLEQRSQVTAYTPTTTQPITNYIPVLQTAAAGVPRFDHSPVTGESLGLLIEEQRTNFLKQSEDISQGVWIKQRTSVITGYVSPFGSFAGKLIPSSDVNSHLLSQSFSSSAGTYTLSAYVKAGEYSRLQLYLNDSTTGSAGVIVNLAAKTASATTSGSWTNTSVFINELTNGWFRVGVTSTQGAGTGVSCIIAMYENQQNSVFAGDGFSGIYVTGLQLEAGAFPTSYIKTEASQVTRAADSAQMTGANFSSWYRQDEGVLLFHSRRPLLSAGAIQVSDGTTSNRMIVSGDASNFDRGYVTVDGAMDSTISVSSNTGGFDKKALAYRFNDIAYAKNGSAPGIDTASRVPVVNQLSVPTLTASFHIKKFSYYPKRLSDAQLQALTA